MVKTGYFDRLHEKLLLEFHSERGTFQELFAEFFINLNRILKETFLQFRMFIWVLGWKAFSAILKKIFLRISSKAFLENA